MDICVGFFYHLRGLNVALPVDFHKFNIFVLISILVDIRKTRLSFEPWILQEGGASLERVCF